MLLATELPVTPFTLPMAREAGLSRRRVDDLLMQHELRRVLRNVYVRADVPDTVQTRAAAAMLVISRYAVICDRTAAWLLGIDTFDYRELEILPPIESYVLRGHNRTRRAQCSGGVRDLSAHDYFRVGDVRVTTPLRTALDLACKLSARDALAALDAFMRHHGITHHEMRRELVRYYRRRGVLQARAVVPLADPRAESPGESRTRMEMLARGLPRPELQWHVDVGGGRFFALDLAYPKHKVAVEYDGREFHESDERREHDRRRRKWLTDHGWTVIVVTKDRFTRESVDEWIQEIRAGLGLFV
jgi:Protein of unknown function (DUF559)